MSDFIKGIIATVVAGVVAGTLLFWITGLLSLPIKIASLAEKIENLKEINNKQANSLASTKNKLTEISETVYFILGKIGAQKGVNSKRLIAASTAKGNSKSKSLKILQGVISQPSLEAKKRFLQEQNFQQNEINSIVTSPQRKPTK